MNSGPLIFVGVFLTFASAWVGLVLVPFLELDPIQPVTTETGQIYPVEPGGLIAEGRQVYIENGCLYCHSQQIRSDAFGADKERGWGNRQSEPIDYIYDKPHLLGSMRTGPDLSTIGNRQPDDNWHHLHLYNPRSVSPGSIMAPFRYLYEVREIVGETSGDALQLPDNFEPAPPKGHEIVPTREAKALVAYLKSMQRDVALPIPVSDDE